MISTAMSDPVNARMADAHRDIGIEFIEANKEAPVGGFFGSGGENGDGLADAMAMGRGNPCPW